MTISVEYLVVAGGGDFKSVTMEQLEGIRWL